MLAELDPQRPVAVCRELTKLHEEIVRGPAAELAERYASEAPRGEVVLVIAGAAAGAADAAAGAAAVRRLVEAGARPRVAAGRRRGADGTHGELALPLGAGRGLSLPAPPALARVRARHLTH